MSQPLTKASRKNDGLDLPKWIRINNKRHKSPPRTTVSGKDKLQQMNVVKEATACPLILRDLLLQEQNYNSFLHIFILHWKSRLTSPFGVSFSRSKNLIYLCYTRQKKQQKRNLKSKAFLMFYENILKTFSNTSFWKGSMVVQVELWTNVIRTQSTSLNTITEYCTFVQAQCSQLTVLFTPISISCMKHPTHYHVCFGTQHRHFRSHYSI